jgi:hypothetical protein
MSGAQAVGGMAANVGRLGSMWSSAPHKHEPDKLLAMEPPYLYFAR